MALSPARQLRLQRNQDPRWPVATGHCYHAYRRHAVASDSPPSKALITTEWGVFRAPARLAMQSTIDFEARKLFEAIKYQIHVAIEYCHKLEDDQSLWIEVYGDVAVDNEGAVEVKMWEDDLSDGHSNFWNTLHNWLKPAFDHHRFKELILLTTQSFGSRSKLSTWNESDAAQRLILLNSIDAAIGKT